MTEADPSVRDTDKIVKSAKDPSNTVKDVEGSLFTEFGTVRKGEH